MAAMAEPPMIAESGKQQCAFCPGASGVPAPIENLPRWKGPADSVLAALLLLATAPVMALAVALIKATSSGPAFYSQVRVGRRGRPFLIYKLRSMFHECEARSGPQWSRHGDQRVTAVGRFLRTTHIDELPQLWNVLRGDMSLVGPRPERPEFVPDLDRLIPRYRDRLLVRPGLTGLAQVQLPPDTHLDSVRKKLAYDLFYVRHLSPWLDVQLLLATAWHVLHLPFGVARALLRLLSGRRVEALYDCLAAEARAVT
jgi:lipopolysaccharide/colanic/teichoic acid biosynthesis glycosyltransferase